MEPEPIREPQPEILPEPLPDDVQILIGVPGPPPVAESAPLIAGTGGVTNPVRIEESFVPPRYPDVARVARIEGNVILQAVIDREGAVDEIQVLRSSQPGVGFEDAAIEAVAQWRYEPATQGGRPVEVYFTIVVDFDLL
jgi:protein TonB